MTKKILILLLIVALIGGLLFFKNQQSKRKGTWIPLKKGTLIEAVYGIGTVTPKSSYQLKTAMATTLEQLYVEEGQNVQKGQKLALMDTLFEAPFSGTITAVTYKQGETITPQTPVLTLVDLQNCYLVVNIEQQGAVRLKIGQKAILSFDNLREQPFYGRVKHIYSHSGQFLVHIECPKLPKQLLPGMTADVAITLLEKPNVLMLPILALKEGVVTRRRDNSIEKIHVQTGTVDNQEVEILSSNLKMGDDVLVPIKTQP